MEVPRSSLVNPRERVNMRRHAADELGLAEFYCSRAKWMRDEVDLRGLKLTANWIRMMNDTVALANAAYNRSAKLKRKIERGTC
jgi:hypothetical protein